MTEASPDDPVVQLIWTALATVIDPELALDVVTLGLVFDVEVQHGVARVTHTLTTPGCPMEHIISEGMRDAVAQVQGITRVETRLVWDPAWHPGMISPHAFSD